MLFVQQELGVKLATGCARRVTCRHYMPHFQLLHDIVCFCNHSATALIMRAARLAYGLQESKKMHKDYSPQSLSH